MRRLIAINRLCLLVGACGICLWSNVRLTGSILRPTANFESNQIILDAVVLGGNDNVDRRASGEIVTSMLTTHRRQQHSAISSSTPGNMGSLSSTTMTASVLTSSRGTAPSELDDVLDRIYNETGKINVKNTTTIIIPKQIFMFWDKGWNHAPPLQQLARQIAQRLNPSYELHALDSDMIEERSNRRMLLDDEFFGKLSIQAKSDVYRTLLLYKYGGIWIDATVFVNKPLDDWLGGYINRSHTDLWGFQRSKPLPMRRPIDPFMGSWFLAAPQKSKTVANILRVIMKEPHRLTKEYFWWHRIVSELAQQHNTTSNDNNDTTTTLIRRSLFSDNVLPSMNPCLQRVSTWKRSAPVIKKRSLNQFAMAFSVWKDCCGGGGGGGGGDDNTGVSVSDTTHLCAKFRCDILAVNFELTNEIKEAYNRTVNSWQQSFKTPQYQLEQVDRTITQHQ